MSRGARVAAAAVAATGTLIGVALASTPPSVLTESTELSTQPVTCTLPGDGSTAAGLTADQTSNAATIVATGKALGVPERGLVVAIATAMQESTLTNLTGGHLDSVGLFQQRTPWGSFEDRTDPAKAAALFFTSNRGPGLTGLVNIDGWQTMPVWQAAQAVQGSAFPMAYAKWEPLARTMVAGVGVECGTGTVGQLPGRTVGEKAVNAALDVLGTPYSWGGGSWQGPTLGIAQGAGTVGFDCSGLTMHAWFQAAGIKLDHYTDNQARASVRVQQADARAGDLIFFSASGGGIDSGTYPHMGLYDGQGGIIHAPRTGKNVERVANIFTHPYWSGRIAMIGRPKLMTP